MRMIALAFPAVLAFLPPPALAAPFPCGDAAVSPYVALVDTGHDHRRMAPVAATDLSKTFTAFFAAFDNADDDTSDGQPDVRVNPEFIAYELRGVAPDANGDYPEPNLSIIRPKKWYTSPDLVPLVEHLSPAPIIHTAGLATSGIAATWP